MQKLVYSGILAACLVAVSQASCPDVTGTIIDLQSIGGTYYLTRETNRPWLLPKKCTVNSYTMETSTVDLDQTYRYTWFLLNLFSFTLPYTVDSLPGGESISQSQSERTWFKWFKTNTDYTVIASETDYLVLYTCKTGLLGSKQKTLVFSRNKTLSTSDETTIKTLLEDQSLSTDLENHPQTC